MKLPSLRQIRENAYETYARFPFVLFSAAAGTAAVLVIIQNDLQIYLAASWLHNAAAVAFLGIPLFFALQLVAEEKGWSFKRSFAVQLSMLFLLIVYYFLLPLNIFESDSVHLIRYCLFIIAAHLCASFAAFTDRGRAGAFWDFNKSLFLRFATAALYSAVLFAGLSAALAAVDQLFGVEIRGERYFQLWWLLVGIFNTWFFLSGVPRKAHTSDADIRYPKGLKIFAQYVMMPLVAVYVCILYAYMGKILLQWDWPKGWVGYLVLGFSTTGIFSLLLIHPIKDRAGNSWMAAVWRWFYVVILPLVVLLMLAVWRRTSEYGLTEKRYFVVVLGFWLAAIALYFLISKAKSIKLIPITLCALALLVSFGPWGAFSLSENDQVRRLEEVLTHNRLLVDGKAQKATTEISFKDAKRINSIVRYLSETHGIEVLQPWFDERIDSGMANQARWYKQHADGKRIAALLGVRYIDEWEQSASDERPGMYTVRSDTLQIVPLNEYRYLVRNITLGDKSNKATIHLGHERWDISLERDSARIVFTPSADVGARFAVDLKDRLERLRAYGLIEYVNNPAPRDLMTISVTHGTLHMQVFLESLLMQVTTKRVVPSTLTMDIVAASGTP